MTWVKQSDDFARRPEMIEAGAVAFAVACWALGESSALLTDGRVTDASLRGCPWVTRKAMRDRHFALLEVAGFWVRNGNGYDIVDWEQYLLSRAEVLEKRAATSARVAAFRERKKKKGNAAGNGVTGKGGNATPDPTRKGRGGTTPPLSDEDGSRRSAQSAPLGTASSEDLKCRGCGKTLGSAYGSDWDWLDDEMTIRWCDGCFRTPGLLEQYHEARKRAAANGSVGSGQVDAHDLDDIDLGGTA